MFYSLLARGERVPRPYHFRWLLPRLCRQNMRLWHIAQAVSLIAVCGLTAAYTGVWWAALLPLGLSGVLFNIRYPVLVDLPAMALALGSAVLWQKHWWWAAVALVVIAGCVKETAPIFATIFAWHPVLLVGILSVGIRTSVVGAGTLPISTGPAAEALRHPFRSSWGHHRALPLWVWVLPWGILLAAVTNGSPQLWVALGLAYAQCVIATDTVRLYQWAAPALALAAVPVLDGPWLPLLLVLHLVNPFKTEGI